MSLQLIQALVVMLVVSAASAQVTLNCRQFGLTESYSWSPNLVSTLYVQTTYSGLSIYSPSMTCIIIIQANIPGRVAIDTTSSSLSAYSAAISIRTDFLSGYIADWNQLGYITNPDRQYVSKENRLYIAFTTRSSPFDTSTGVRLTLTFLGTTSCLPAWTPMTLTQSGRRQNHCVRNPTTSTFRFGDAQRYCNQLRSNLLVSEGDKVSTVMGRVSTFNTWIGMTAEPSGSSSYYKWLSNYRVNNESISCTGSCNPTKHKCVYPMSQTALAQVDCDTKLRPLCSMPAGGTDIFFAGSAKNESYPSMKGGVNDRTRASAALLAGATLLQWGLRR